MSSLTFSKAVTNWELIVNAVAANAVDLASLEPLRVELHGVLQVAMELGNQQDAIQARAQQTSRELGEQLRRGEALAARLRAGIRAQYGYKSEKLTEFQLRPFRRRSRGPVETPPRPTEAPAPDPTTAA
jgi:hypothetical protein